jgi:ATPase subunit of ABC transporter with duplicated ATPase domains
MVPKVVAQHHCSPPPSSETMASWLNSLRKRHGKQYLAMQTVLKELQYFKERKDGYQESKKSDKERQKREQEEAQRLLEEQQAEQERLDALEERRKQLLQSLPEEATGKDAKKIALRFADGRSAQRSFHPDQPLTDVFNWVDAMYEIERETVILTTMNGKQTLVWDDHAKTLMDAGVDKNTGFRVSSQEGKAQEGETPEK